MTMDDRGTVHVEADDVRPVRVFGEVVTRKVASERTGGAYTLSEAVVRPGRGVPPHIHHREDECFYILEGAFDFTIEGRSLRATPGSLVYVSKGTLHAYENVGADTAKLLVWQTPGGLCERYYAEVGEAADTEDASRSERDLLEVTRIATTAARYGIEIVLPRTAGR